MINLTQTVEYVKICKEAGIDCNTRSMEQLTHVLPQIANPDIRRRLTAMIVEPKTDIAYLEYMRIYSSLIALGLIDDDHPTAFLNARKFRETIQKLGNSDDILDLAFRYDLDDLSPYGKFINIAKDVYERLENSGKMGRVFTTSHLYRLIELHRFAVTNNVVHGDRVELISEPCY